MATIFKKIIDREIPADIVYEDDDVLAFLDITPINKGHTLVIPKKEFENVFDGDAETLGKMMIAAQKIAIGIKQALAADGVNIIMNNGEHAGQEVFHAHIHVVPRYKNDNSFSKPAHVEYDENESDTTATQIIAAMEE